MAQATAALAAIPPPITNFSPTLGFDSEHLFYRPVRSSHEDKKFWATVRTDPAVCPSFGDGAVPTWHDLCTRVDTLSKRWRDEEGFSAFLVFEKTPNGPPEIAGIVALNPGDAPGEAVISYLFLQKYWHRPEKFGTEAVTTVLHRYAPSTIAARKTVVGGLLSHVTATARADNLGSNRILLGLGFQNQGAKMIDGAMRNQYVLRIDKQVEFVRALIEVFSRPLVFLILSYMGRELGYLVHTWTPSCILEGDWPLAVPPPPAPLAIEQPTATAVPLAALPAPEKAKTPPPPPPRLTIETKRVVVVYTAERVVTRPTPKHGAVYDDSFVGDDSSPRFIFRPAFAQPDIVEVLCGGDSPGCAECAIERGEITSTYTVALS